MARTIKTTYYDTSYDSVRVNSSSNANRAVANCVMHMQLNDYGAVSAEVYDDDDGLLHAQVKRYMDGRIVITYKRDPIEYENRYATTMLLKRKG